MVGDGHLGIWGALRNVYPEVAEQRCWNHRVLNVLAQLPRRRQAEARKLLTAIPYADSAREAGAQDARIPAVVSAGRIPERAAELIDED